MSSASRNAVRNFITIVISGLIIAASVWIFLNRQFVLDSFTNWTFEPSTAISSISERTEFTDKGQFMFYATRPEVLESDTFNKECPRQEPGSPILGCYTSTDRIFMYNVTDQQLDGIKEVTAAHEMLHAAWQRLDQEEKDRLSVLLKDVYDKNASDALRARMKYYTRTEPTEIANELHSILGTEMANVGSELEDYYNQYFNRQTVLALYNNYNGLYQQLSDEATSLYDEMQKLSASIETQSKQYNNAVEVYSADIQTFNRRADSNAFDSNAQFYSERAALVARSNQLEATRVSINASIATYNTHYAKYQQIADQLQILNNSMDSLHTLEEAPSV